MSTLRRQEDNHDPLTELASQDNDGNSTHDSAIALDDDYSSTASLRSSEYAYPFHHRRRYNAFCPNTYFAPNDDEEQDRLDVQHEAIMKATGERLFYAPVQNLHHVLDLGTGTGLWAIVMGDKYSKASITGVDISPIQPTFVPPNVQFELDDLEEQWTWRDNSYDLIRSSQMLSGSIKNIPRYLQQAFSCCMPGGFFEIQELCMKTASDQAPVPDTAGMQQWFSLMNKGIARFGGEGRRFHHDLENVIIMMKAAGFVEIGAQSFHIPLGRWPKDPLLKQAGMLQLVAMVEGLGSLTLAPLIRGLGWELEEVEILLANARTDVEAPKKYYYLPWYVVWGKKPS